MNSLRNNNYKMKKHDKDTLLGFGFRHSRIYSLGNDECYYLEFPVYKHGSTTSLWGRIVISVDTGDVMMLDVFDTKNEIYPAFYQNEIKNNNVIEEINKKFTGRFKKYGIKKVS